MTGRTFVSAARILCAAVLAALGACSVPGSSAEVAVSLPAAPGPWVAAWGAPGYRVEWQVTPSTGGSVTVEAGRERVVLELPVGAVVPVLAWPTWRGGGPALQPGENLCPAGGIWFGDDRSHAIALAPVGPVLSGWSLEPASLGPAYRDGPVTLALFRAAGRGADLRHFNSARLKARIDEAFPVDPWTLDVSRIIRAICEGSMRVSYVRPMELMSVSVQVPPGSWYPASPFAPLVTGGSAELELPTGVNALYDGNGRRLVVDVDEDAGAWCAILPPDSPASPAP